MKRIAFIGCSSIFEKHANAISHIDELQIVAVADINESLLRRRETECGCVGYLDYKKMIAEQAGDLDYVVVASPSHLHAEHARYALQQGCNVLLEKPPTLTYEEFVALCALADEKQLQLFAVLQLRYDAVFQRVKQAVQEGLFGQITITSLDVFFQRKDDYYGSWRCDEEKSGGILYDIGIHYLDAVVTIIQSEVATALARSFHHTRHNASDTYHAIVEFQNGASGSVCLTVASEPRTLGTALTIIGTRGSIRLGGPQLNECEQVQFVHAEDQDRWNSLVTQLNPPHKTGGATNFIHMYQALARREGIVMIDAAPVMRSLELLRTSE